MAACENVPAWRRPATACITGGAGRHWGNIPGAERRGAGGQWDRRSVGQDVVGQNVTGAISLGQNVVGQEVSGAGRRGAELRGAGRRWGKISGAGGHGTEGSGAGSGSP